MTGSEKTLSIEKTDERLPGYCEQLSQSQITN